MKTRFGPIRWATVVVLAICLVADVGEVVAAASDQTPAWVAAMVANPERAKIIAAENGVNWCRTQDAYAAKYPENALSAAACATEGPCDVPGTRDASIPDSASAKLTIRLKFNVFRDDDGSNPAASQADVDAQVDQLNADYDPARIQFVYTTEFINSSQFRQYSDSEEGAMKNSYADLPAEQMNIYVINILGGYLGEGTFPWDLDALTNTGGIVVDDNWFGAGEKTLTHEIGHNLGLWHTHHGVSEVNQCGGCWERADGVDGDVTGDFCGDTDPTPVNYNCSPPGGTDPCSGQPWGATDPQNYMGYAPDFCYTEFSPQQFGRMHCWITNELAGWLALGFQGTPLTGAESVTVNFTYDSPLNTSAWKWHFGDGDSAMVENPTHVYGPGLFDVSLTATTDVGILSTLKQDYVTVWADTIGANDISVESDTAGYWELWGVNKVPVTEFVLPVTLTNVTSVLFFDSISFVGTRFEYFELQEVVYDNRFAGQLAMHVKANNGGGSPALPPGRGPIARVYFRSRVTAVPGDTSFLSMVPLSLQTLKATTLTTTFEPVSQGATLTIVPPACDCSSHGDVAEDNGVYDAIDLGALIDVVFFSAPLPATDPLCPHIDRGDLNCDGIDDAIDLGYMIDLVFFSGAVPCDPCACNPYPSNCP